MIDVSLKVGLYDDDDDDDDDDDMNTSQHRSFGTILLNCSNEKFVISSLDNPMQLVTKAELVYKSGYPLNR